jgi:DNA gyrase subunit A
MDGESAEAGTAAAGDIVPESGEAQQSDQAEQADEE